jgi:ComF family protein
MIRAALDALLAALLCPPCAACGQPLDRPLAGAVCDACWAALPRLQPPLCDGCAEPLASLRMSALADGRCGRCRRLARPVTLARAAGAYEGALRHIVHALKYDGRRSLAAPLAAHMREAGAEALRGATQVVPVPLHPKRLRQRGFNQAELLARGLGTPMAAWLTRVRDTPPQVALPEARRHGNVRAAFAVTRSGRREAPGAVVVLVDDVATTGATLDACARALMEAGAAEVRALTAARAARGRR